MALRRDLNLSGLDDVKREIKALLAGHQTVGQWSLGQMCHHLARVVRYSTSSPDPQGEPVAATAQQAAIRDLFFASKFPEGRDSPAAIKPKPGLDDAAEVSKLSAAIDRFSSDTGPYAVHPMLGPLSREEWARFHCMHAAHHLSFAVPE